MAINGHFIKIVFIHGVGNGVLRQTIRDLLRTYEGIEYSDASYKKFGAGATEVTILSRNKARGSL
jgi:dsDNA-specific endonuclease/ATPase MutS2